MAPVRYVVRRLQCSKGNRTHRVETFGGDDIDFLNSRGFKGLKTPSTRFFVFGSLATFTFGLIHLAAWNFEFPSALERTAWRYSAVVLVCIPLCMSLMAAVRSSFGPFNLLVSCLFMTIFVGLALAYVASRILLVVIMLTTLRNLPPSAYKTIPWAEVIPHI